MNVVDENELPPCAIRVHLGTYQDALRPRGSMQKNSLGDLIYERLAAAIQHWTNPQYGDNPDWEELTESLVAQARTEADAAIDQFLQDNHFPPQTKE